MSETRQRGYCQVHLQLPRFETTFEAVQEQFHQCRHVVGSPHYFEHAKLYYLHLDPIHIQSKYIYKTIGQCERQDMDFANMTH